MQLLLYTRLENTYNLSIVHNKYCLEVQGHVHWNWDTGLPYSCLITTSLCLYLKILCCLSAYQAWLSAQLAVSASLLCSFQPEKTTNRQLNRTSVKAPLHDVEHDMRTCLLSVGPC